MAGMKDTAIMVLANGVYAEVITTDQAMNVLKAMDDSAQGTPEELDARAKALTPIFTEIHQKYLLGGI